LRVGISRFSVAGEPRQGQCVRTPGPTCYSRY
jgi:hypothetical protein